MAHWAKWLFWATAATIVLTLFGLYLIGRTLHHTRRAADAAQAANVGFQEASRRELRAYVHTTAMVVDDFVVGKQPTFRCHIENGGLTPAHSVGWVTGVEITEAPGLPSVRFLTQRLTAIPRMYLAPRSHAVVRNRLNMVLKQQFIDAVRDGKANVYFSGIISYRNGFNRLRRFIFQAQVNLNNLDDKGHGPLAIAPKHNKGN